MTEPCPGPVPPQTPRLTAPSGACDTHAHILGPYDRFPLNENRSYTAPESTFEDYMHLLEVILITITQTKEYIFIINLFMEI